MLHPLPVHPCSNLRHGKSRSIQLQTLLSQRPPLRRKIRGRLDPPPRRRQTPDALLQVDHPTRPMAHRKLNLTAKLKQLPRFQIPRQLLLNEKFRGLSPIFRQAIPRQRKSQLEAVCC